VSTWFQYIQKRALLEETAYYPFGLTMAGISSKASSFGDPANKKKFNGYEESKDFGLNWLESFYRTYDPQLGRFWQVDPRPDERISPYTAMGNNPISLNDLLGDTTRYYDSKGVPLYTTYVKGYNNVTIVNDELVEAFAQITGKLGELSLKQQAEFDWVATFLGIGITYDIGAMSNFYRNEADKNTAKTIKGTSIALMGKLRFNGKPIDPESIKAETSADLVMRNGKITVGNLRHPNTELTSTYAPGNMWTQPGYTGAHIHLHPNRPDGIFEWYIGASPMPGITIISNGGPSAEDQYKTILDMSNHPIRNVVVDRNFVYLINGNKNHTISTRR
jgi:RHS repeat-associated protein